MAPPGPGAICGLPHNNGVQASVGATASQRTETVRARPPRLTPSVSRLVTREDEVDVKCTA